MSVYISLLRGVNVGGRKVPMAELRTICDELKLKNVATYIQSGNIIFESSASAASLEKKLEKKLLEQYGFEVRVINKTPKEMDAVIKKNPFAKRKDVSPERIYVTFLMENPAKENIEKVLTYNFPPDEFVVLGTEIYIHCPISYGNSKLNNNFFENKLKVAATTRNWRTVNELLKMGKGL